MWPASHTHPHTHTPREKRGEVLTARAGPRVQVVQLIIREGVVVPRALEVHGPLKVLTAPALSLGRAEAGTGSAPAASSLDTPRGTADPLMARVTTKGRHQVWPAGGQSQGGPTPHFLPPQGPGQKSSLLVATTTEDHSHCPDRNRRAADPGLEPESWICVLAPSLTKWVAWGKLLRLSVPLFPHYS